MMINIRSRGRRAATGLIAGAVGFAVVGGGAAIATGAFTNGDQINIQQLPGSAAGSHVWPTNANGQTYGSLQDSTSSATDPHLIQAIATNGKTGYVYASQLNAAGPASPAQALARQAATTTPQYIPVYAQDGTTVIGQFEVSEPNADTRPLTRSSPPSGN